MVRCLCYGSSGFRSFTDNQILCKKGKVPGFPVQLLLRVCNQTLRHSGGGRSLIVCSPYYKKNCSLAVLKCFRGGCVEGVCNDSVSRSVMTRTGGGVSLLASITLGGEGTRVRRLCGSCNGRSRGRTLSDYSGLDVVLKGSVSARVFRTSYAVPLPRVLPSVVVASIPCKGLIR